MNVLDSSAWLEYFADGPNADFFAPAVEAVEQLLVPAVCFFDDCLALEAAKLSNIKKLTMADSILLATAWTLRAELWTQDSDFEGLDSVHLMRRA